jgi:hypothetical protein
MRMPVGALTLVVGCTLGFAAVHIALDRACSRHYECDASHPTLSMTLRHGDVRRNVVPMLLASSVCLLLADCALWATCCSDQRGGGLITTHAALLAGIASLPAMVLTIEKDPRGQAHLDAAVAWSALRMVQGALALPAVWLCTRGSAPFAVVNAGRLVLAVSLMCVGAKLCADAPSGDMDGELQFIAVRGVLAYHLTLVPETAGARVVLFGDGGTRVRMEASTRYIPGWNKDAGGSYSVRDEDASV